MRLILKLSGEALKGNTNIYGKDKLNKIALELKSIIDESQKDNYEIGIVIGAGNIWRGRIAKDCDMDEEKADYLGMVATILNSLALEDALSQKGLKVKVLSAISIPSLAEDYKVSLADKYLKEGYIVIFAAGTGLPHYSTDTCAALRAKELGASLILMAKNGVDGVYSSDPKKDPNAFKYQNLSYQTILDNNLAVMDLSCAAICQEAKIKTYVFDMNQEGNIKKVLSEPTIGTIIE